MSKPWRLQEHCYSTAGPFSAAGFIGATLPQFGWRLSVALRNHAIWVMVRLMPLIRPVIRLHAIVHTGIFCLMHHTQFHYTRIIQQEVC